MPATTAAYLNATQAVGLLSKSSVAILGSMWSKIPAVYFRPIKRQVQMCFDCFYWRLSTWGDMCPATTHSNMSFHYKPLFHENNSSKNQKIPHSFRNFIVYPSNCRIALISHAAICTGNGQAAHWSDPLHLLSRQHSRSRKPTTWVSPVLA